ncbi:hypothetical protein BDV95DRAFT_606117 [Massariosphaeria phaeospora]|uniref:Only prolin and serin are matching in the corresponding protein n=1 Tax=Massariosphaeria phaeospora TaxID=100035 RepID=A0A7C8IAW0_9PLEO|nr:hypothetical protein BDV95DRAFT_606117 [Massariosphaeria phaeospora]
MREMKPLILPQLVAARKSSKSSLDMSSEPTSAVISCADSGFYSASECSTPPTPGFGSRGHYRFPSSTSSLSTSPPTHDPADAPNPSGKLPQLTEEPVEREDDYVTDVSDVTVVPDRCECYEEQCWHALQQADIERAYDFAEQYINCDSASHTSKRRRSMESTTQSITNKLENRFPSLKRKMRDRKRTSTLGRTSRSTTPARVSSTRSSSMTSSIHQFQGTDLIDRFSATPTPAAGSRERLQGSITSSPIDIAKANAFDMDAEQSDAQHFATTPLLPPMLVKTCFDDVPAQSPLQSPAVATQSLVATPIDTPSGRAYPSPPLSSKPSVSSFKASRPGHLVPSSDIPSMVLTDPTDKWVNKLGHANFTIQPEPYVPETCNTTTLGQLFTDWEEARRNFTKHQVRTGEHHGVTSKTYLLTDQKWAEIDGIWRTNYDIARTRAATMGEEPEPASPLEPAPLSKMPTLHDPKAEGKFPKLGDEDIVGPMIQIASQIHETLPRKRGFFKFFSDMKFPGSFLGRSSAGGRRR